VDLRSITNAIFYVLKGGISWRMLPREFAHWKTVYHYFRLWRLTGLWDRIHVQHIVVDVLGLILAVAVTGANVQDRDGGQSVLKGLKDRFPRIARVWADGAYAGRLVEWAQKTARFVLDIVCKPKGQIGFSVLPWRWIVERTFAYRKTYIQNLPLGPGF